MCVFMKKTALGKRVGFYSHFLLNNSLKRGGMSTALPILAMLLNSHLFQYCKLFFSLLQQRWRHNCIDKVFCDVLLHYQVIIKTEDIKQIVAICMFKSPYEAVMHNSNISQYTVHVPSTLLGKHAYLQLANHVAA